MSRPFFTKERIGHFELFERHTGMILDWPLMRVRCDHRTPNVELALGKIRERAQSGTAFDFQVGLAISLEDRATPSQLVLPH